MGCQEEWRRIARAGDSLFSAPRSIHIFSSLPLHPAEFSQHFNAELGTYLCDKGSRADMKAIHNASYRENYANREERKQT
jgi:hypothetical protein